MDYYVVLGIAEDADDEMIRSAFRALARRYHPDVGAGSSPVEFQRAREAYETLVDPERRRQYDQLRAFRRQHPVVVREVIVSRRVAEPVVDLRRFSFGVPGTFVTVTRPSFFDDELIEDFFASFDDRWLCGRRRW
jgi:curved DNA-binding protein CbpA